MASRRLLFAGALAAFACAFPAEARPSQLVDRNASDVVLEVSRRGKVALLSYKARGRQWRVLLWNGINARPPKRGARQIRLKADYAGGWGRHHRPVWRRFRNHCRPYDGPPIAWLVTACRAPDGSYWAVQSWQRLLPNFGARARGRRAAWELRVSHWQGELPVLSMSADWAYGRFDHLFGSLSYLGRPVHGFRATRQGSPLDTFGRNVYVDTLNSRYGPGWKREMGFLVHQPLGNFCYTLFDRPGRPSGRGEAYRATVVGPGVTPDLFWQGAAPGPYDAGLDSVLNAAQMPFASSSCRPNSLPPELDGA